MILDNIKSLVSSYIGENHKFIYYGSRNQKEEFDGVILKVYPAVFLILSNNGQIRSYSYNDILTTTLEILN